nr:hypothetical protein [uncultured Shuttleworthia sp.]
MEEGKQNFFEEDVTEQKTSDSELDSELESEKTEPTKDAESEGENPASGEADSGIAEDDKEGSESSEPIADDQTETRTALPPVFDQTAERDAQEGKTFFGKYRKFIVPIIAVLIVLIVGAGVKSFIDAQPVKLSKELKVEFEGYDGYGTVKYNKSKLDEKIMEVSYKKAGLPLNQMKHLESGSGNYLKIAAAEVMRNNVSYGFDKTDHLKNGDKIVFTVACEGDKKAFVSETKEYTVRGLKEFQQISLEDFQKEYPIQFIGYNKFGSVQYDSTIYDINANLDGSLANDTAVKVGIRKDALEDLAKQGKKLQDDTNEIVVKVSGLKEVTEISGLKDMFDAANTYMQAKTKNDDYRTYQVEKQKDYIKFSPSGSRSEKGDEGSVSARTVYKVTETVKYFLSDNSSTKTYFTYFGCENMKVVDGRAILKTDSYGYTSVGSQWANLESIQAELKSSGFAEYTAQQ